MRLGGEPPWVTDRKAGADEPYEGIVHVRICGGRRGQHRPLPGTQQPPAFSAAIISGSSVVRSAADVFLRRLWVS